MLHWSCVAVKLLLVMHCCMCMGRVMQAAPFACRGRHVPQFITNGRLCRPFMHEGVSMVQFNVNCCDVKIHGFQKRHLKCGENKHERKKHSVAKHRILYMKVQ